jgi:xanthine dehydrogenase YagS FAD-binding subunit
VKPFAYVDARNEKDAVAALAGGRAMALGGGQDLLALMKDHILEPEQLVNVKTLDRTIAAVAGGGYRIGSAVRLADLASHEGVKKTYPALTNAASEVGTPQIRNVATVGGNICQRPRCWYFRNEEFHCLKKGGKRCYSEDGENQFHAIFGGGPCYIVHPSSLAVPVMAYDGRFRVVGPKGAREVPAEDFFVLPSEEVMKENVLGPGELVTHVILPATTNVRSANYEVRFKQSHDWPIAMASAALTMQGDVVASARLVMGAVAPVPFRPQAAERVLVGQRITPEIALKAGEVAVASATPMSGNAYKIQVAKTAVKRAVLLAAGLPWA